MTKYLRVAMAAEAESETSHLVSSPSPNNTHTFSIPETNTLSITGHKLNEHNFNQWSTSVVIFVCGREK